MKYIVIFSFSSLPPIDNNNQLICTSSTSCTTLPQEVFKTLFTSFYHTIHLSVSSSANLLQFSNSVPVIARNYCTDVKTLSWFFLFYSLLILLVQCYCTLLSLFLLARLLHQTYLLFFLCGDSNSTVFHGQTKLQSKSKNLKKINGLLMSEEACDKIF